MTVREIAKLVGVSASTVSRVMRGRGVTDSSTHKRILALIKEGGVAPRPRATTSGLVLCVSPGTFADDMTHTAMLENLLDESARTSGLGALMLRNAEPDVVRRTMNEHDVAGLIWIDTLPTIEVTTPAVVINKPQPLSSRVSSVDCDDASGVVAALSHLAARGHVRVAFFADGKLDEHQTHPRKSDVPRLYRDAGLAYDRRLAFGEDFAPGEHSAAIARAMKQFTGLRDRPTALFVCGDVYVPDVYDELQRHGLSIPRDMSVVGFDDFSICRALRPELTSVRKPIVEMAEEAARVLAARIKRPDLAPVRIFVRPEVVARSSVADVSSRPRRARRERT